jgi:sugar (pentulose or hexulose) kinase
MADQQFLAFDLGAESGRAMLGTLAVGKLSLEEKHRFANPMGRMNGHLFWNLLAQWEELKTGLKKTSAGLNGALSGIGVDTWGVDFGLIGGDGQVLGNPYMYRDSRTDGVMERTFAKLGRERIFDTTGIQFMQLNSLYQLIAMHESRSPALEAAETLLFMPDLFNYLFSGERKSEFSIATTSQMYDPQRREWAVGMLKELGLPTKILPAIVPSGTILGRLKSDVASECGAKIAPIIAPACHDTGSAVAAVPAQGEGWCYISSGTWSLMGVELTEPIINAKSLRYNYTNEGGVGGTIRFLKNIMGLWLVQECRRQFASEGKEYDYATLTEMARNAKPGAVIDPDHKPFGSPGQMPQKIVAFCKETGQTPPGTHGELVRCCLDSLALTYRRTLDGLEDVLGKKISTIHVVGGGCRNELLNQATADACNRPVIAGPIEATAAGNILVQAMATGAVKSLAEARQIVARSFEVKRYEPKSKAEWDDAYARYQKVLGHSL